MKKIFNVAVICIALMFVGCGGGSMKANETALCPEVNVAKAEVVSTVVPDSPVIKVTEPVMFDFDSDVVREDQYPVIDRVAKIMESNSDVVLMLEGFASIEGSESYNLDLSKRRAASVKSALVDLGISADRITTNGMGETTQFSNELSPNRRVMVLSVK